MNDRRGCPLFKGSDVEVQTMCSRCGHFNEKTTACDFPVNLRLIELGHLKVSDFHKLHENMGLSDTSHLPGGK